MKVKCIKLLNVLKTKFLRFLTNQIDFKVPLINSCNCDYDRRADNFIIVYSGNGISKTNLYSSSIR